MAGADWITVHGRTANERKEPVHYDVIKLVRSLSACLCVINVFFFIRNTR